MCSHFTPKFENTTMADTDAVPGIDTVSDTAALSDTDPDVDSDCYEKYRGIDFEPYFFDRFVIVRIDFDGTNPRF
jgi:hypothetical protein